MHLPHVQSFANSPLYFFTGCTARRRTLLASEIALNALTNIWTQSGERNGWFIGKFLLMPDHVHYFARPATDAIPRDRWHKLWKSLSSRKISKAMEAPSPVWQADTFDHVLRSADSYSEKWDYVRDNPVRAGFVANPDAWPWKGEIYSLKF